MKIDKTRVFNMDCMEYMRSVEDGYFELAVERSNYFSYIVNKNDKGFKTTSDWESRRVFSLC